MKKTLTLDKQEIVDALEEWALSQGYNPQSVRLTTNHIPATGHPTDPGGTTIYAEIEVEP